ncbi:hypothetical protein [Azospirillum argentinense]
MFLIAALLGGLAWFMGIPLVLTWWLGGITTLFVTAIACLSGLVALSVLYRSEPADLLR